MRLYTNNEDTAEQDHVTIEIEFNHTFESKTVAVNVRRSIE